MKVRSLSIIPSPKTPSEDEMRASHLRQYRRAAERGEISFVKYWRLVREMDATALSDAAGLPPDVIAKAERAGGPARIGRAKRERLARALHVPIELLV